MKMKRALAAAIAAAMTATSCLVYELPAEAAAAVPYAKLVGVSANAYVVPIDILTFEEGTRTYQFTITNDSNHDDTYVGGSLNIDFFDYNDMGSDYRVVSVTDANGVKTEINAAVEVKDGVGGYWFSESELAAIGTIPVGKSATVEIAGTYSSVKNISANCFKISRTEFTDMRLGDSFTITYDGTGVADTAAFKIIYLTNRPDSGWTNHLYPVIYKTADGGNGLNGTEGEDETGLRVSAEKTGERSVYTFTAVKPTPKECTSNFKIFIDVSQTGDFSDEQTLSFDGTGEYYIPTVPVNSISIDKPARTTYTAGESVTLTASANGYNTVTDPEFVWSSDNEKAATVDSTGKVSFVGGGKAAITAAYKDDPAVTDTITFDVEVPVSSVTIEKPAKTEYMVGESVILSASVNEDATVSAPTILWSSSDTKVATVDGAGEVKFVGEGSVTITAAYADDASIKDSLTLTAVPDTRDTYIESPIDYTKATKPTLVKTSDGNSLLYVMAVTRAQAEADELVFISVTDKDTGKTARYYTRDVYSGFGFIGENGQKYVETGAEGIYFVVVKFTWNGTVMDASRFTVDMKLLTPVG